MKSVLLVILCTLVPCARISCQGPPRLADVRASVGFDPELGDMVATDLRFTTDDDREVALSDCIDGRPAILALVYYDCPVLCNEVVHALLRSLAAVPLDPGDDYSVILVSIDPGERPRDAASRRAQIQERSGGRAGGPGWSLLTGEDASIRALADAVGFRYRYVPDADEYAHASGVALLSPAGKLTRAFRGLDYPPRDLRLGLVESSRGEVGSVADRLLLLCYHWDPAAGRYGFAVASALRIGGLVTLLGLAVGIGWMLRRERRQRRRV